MEAYLCCFLLCPTEEDLGMLMSSVDVNFHMCGWDGEKTGAMVVEQGH